MAKNNFEMIAQALEKTLIPESSETAKRIDWRRVTILKECRTIGFTATRQSGKTEWIYDRVKENTKHSLVLVPTENLKIDFESIFFKKDGAIPPDLRIISGKVYERGFTHRFREHPITHIYVDEARFYFSTVRREKTYEALLTNFTLAEDVTIYLVS